MKTEGHGERATFLASALHRIYEQEKQTNIQGHPDMDACACE